MGGEEEDDLPALGLVAEGGQLPPDVVGERLDQLGVGRPPVDDAPPHSGRGHAEKSRERMWETAFGKAPFLLREE